MFLNQSYVTNLICVKNLNFLNLRVLVKNLIDLLNYSIYTKLNYSDKIFKETQKICLVFYNPVVQLSLKMISTSFI